MVLTSNFHESVLLEEVLKFLQVREGEKYIDATLGGGGYTFEILKLGGVVLGIDLDQAALDYVLDYVKEKVKNQRLKLKFEKNLFLELGNFANIGEIALRKGFGNVAGIVFDLGMSSYQLEKSKKGFSFRRNEPLDMRMDKTSKETAEDIINNYHLEGLYEIFSQYAEELHSWDIAEAILRARAINKIRTTGDLVSAISQLENLPSKDKTCARIFQAIRIVVNREIENLKKGLEEATKLLKKNGRLVVLSYHSLEDRQVKRKFVELEKKGIADILTKKPVRATREEIAKNSKAASAKLRVIKRL